MKNTNNIGFQSVKLGKGQIEVATYKFNPEDGKVLTVTHKGKRRRKFKNKDSVKLYKYLTLKYGVEHLNDVE